MNANVVNVAVVDGKTLTQTVELSAVKNNSPVRIKAVQGGKYILAEGANGVAPENITIKRVGKDLHIALEGSDPDQPQLIIEDFEGSGGQLVGVAEDGSYHEYISSDAEQDRSAPFLIEGVEAPQVLGAQPLIGFGDGLVASAGIGWFWPALLGLAALGVLAGVYAATRDDDDKHDNTNTDKSSIGSVDDNVGDKQGLIENGGSTDDRTPTFTGEGRPGTSVEIIDNGKTIGTAIVGEDGKWEYTPPAPGLDDGKHDIVVVPVDENGNKGEPSPGYEIIVDTVAPSRPLIDGIYDDVAPQEGQIGSGGHTNDTTPTLSGTAEAGAIIHIYDNGVEIGTALADADGKWSFTPDPALTEGAHEFTVTAEDAAGNISTPSLPFPIIVDITQPGKPGAGTGGIEDALDNVGADQGSIGNGDSTDDSTPTLIGSGAEPGDTVIIIDNGVEIGTAIVGEDGKWEFTPDPALVDGSHEIVVVIKDPAGNESEPSDPYTIIIDTMAPVAPTLTSVIDDQGAVTGDLISGATTDDARPDLSGTAEAGSLVTIYDNGVAIGSVVATDGTWTFTPTVPLSNGPHTLTATATDAAGNVSPPTQGFDLIVAAGGVPPAPAIITVVDDQGASQGPLGQNDFTDDAQPTINGTGADGSIISIFANGVLLGTTTVVNGQWSFTPTTPLAEGLNNLSALATDAAGNPSPVTGDYPINVDTSAPLAPTGQSLTDDVGAITGPILSGDITDDANPTFSGMAEAGAVVMIYDNGNLIGSTTADPATGAWSFTPTTPLADGAHSLAAQAVDRAGNTGPMGPSTPFTVDTSAVVISITSVVDNAGNVTGNLTSGQATDDTTPTLNGQATPGGIVNIYDGTTLLGSVMADAVTGQWSFTTPVLTDGVHSLTATVNTSAGGESAPTPVFETIIDTAAPLAPTIGDVTDDVGSIQGPVADGGSTDDTTPTLSGNGLQPGDVVMIYDNGSLIGSTSVIGDGSWSYTPTTPLNDGSHPFTVVAVDPAGNESLPSAPWTIDIDTSAPIASAVIDSMGKDSGTDSGDFVTNDGSGGRLIQGSLTAALSAGEKVQVSTDGGATWIDAIVNGDKWSFVDQSAHTSDWVIQTRVVDTVGNANASSQSVTLDNSIIAPDSIAWDGTNVTVGFDGASLQVGDKVVVQFEGEIFEHLLTQLEIDAGTVTFAGPVGDANAASLGAAIVDTNGNVSDYRTLNKDISVIVSEDFNSTAAQSLTTGTIVNFGAFSVTSLSTNDGVVFTQRIGDGLPGHSTDVPDSRALEITGAVSLTLDPGVTANTVSIQYGDVTSAEVFTATFRDAAGVVVHTVVLDSLTSTKGTILFELPFGESFHSVDFSLNGVGNAYVFIDDIQFGDMTYEDGGLTPPSVVQYIEQSDVIYYGGEADNTFYVADVGLLDSISAGISGGTGVDTLTLTGTNQVLDLSTVSGQLESIEIIDITGTGNNTLNLSLGDVLEQGETSLFTDDQTMQMMVKGNAGDIVNLDDLLSDGTDPGDWTVSGTATVAGITYNVYQHSTLDAQLLVQDGVTTNLV